MKKGLFIIITLFCLFSGIKAQDMEHYFVSIPDTLLPLLENEWRKDLVDLYKSEKEARLLNMVGGDSRLEKLTSDYLLLQTTESSTFEMKLLPLVNKTHILCVITTVKGPVADSRIDFYTTDWQPLEATDLYTPVTTESFFKDDIKPDGEDEFYLRRLDMNLVHYTLSPDDFTLTARYTTPEYLAKTEREKVLTYLKEEPKVYTWNKSYFK